MPVITEHDKANSIKQKDEVERYLTRIIERYFQIETEYSRASMEAIVQESFTRLKRYMYKYKGFIFSLNRHTGHLFLDIKFFNGEPEIEKNTAFNKDFGNEENTICEGNNKRLYDARIPLDHKHSLNDINNLYDLIGEADKEAMYALLSEANYSHAHNNTDVLNIIKYTGSMAKIDLILLEDLDERITKYLNQIKYHKIEAYNYNNEKNDYLALQLEILTRYFNELKQDVIKKSINWLGVAENYCIDRGRECLVNSINTLLPYQAKEYSELVIKNFETIDSVLAEDTFDLNTVASSVDSYITSDPLETTYNTKDEINLLYEISTNENIGGISNNTWAYDKRTNTIAYNVKESIYNIFYNTNDLYTDYTIRATFKINNSDNGAATIFLGQPYESRLTLIVSPGGVNHNGFTTPPVPHISVVKDFNTDNPILISKRNLTDTSLTKWSNYTDGITILVKKYGNTINVWYSLDSTDWTDYTDKRIAETSTPFISVNIENSMEDFLNSQVNIGFGNFSQIINISNIYIYGLNSFYGYNTAIGGEAVTNCNDSEAFLEYQKHTIGHRIECYFQYKNNSNKLIRTPIPFKYNSNAGETAIINAKYDKSTGYIKAYFNSTLNIPVNLNCPSSLVKGDDVYIPVISLINNDFESTFNALKNCGCDIPVLTETLHNELESIISNLSPTWKNRKYLVKGHVDDTVAYSDFEGTTNRNMYYELRIANQCDGDSYYITMKVDDNNPQNLILNNYSDNNLGFILHYKNSRIAQNINNPQIYFKVLGRKK